jgi:hypothetical protein
MTVGGRNRACTVPPRAEPVHDDGVRVSYRAISGKRHTGHGDLIG